jgi:8-oxo-dGTP pyrophosphatase MutT (NUDIX family)
MQGKDLQTLSNAIELLENNTDNTSSVYLEHLSWDEAFPMLKTKFKFLRAAGGLIQNQSNEFLLIHRLGQWDLPKGKIEKGESDELAAEREILEETGIQVDTPLIYLTTTWHTYKQKNIQVLKETIWYTGKTHQTELPIPQGEESIELAIWCNAAKAQSHLQNSYPSIVDVWNAYIESQGINP